MYTWKFQKLLGYERFDYKLINELREAFNDSLDIQSCSIEDIKIRLEECQLLGLLEDEHGRIYGCVMVTIPEVPLNGSYMIWGIGGYLRKAAQGKAVWRQILKNISECFPEKHFAWIGCRTQNPLMMRSYGLFGSLYPFEADYSAGEGRLLLEYMQEHIPQVRNVTELVTDRGICQGLYPEGRLGNYPVKPNGRIERQLDSWGFDRNRGDSLLVVARLPEINSQGVQEDQEELLLSA